MKKTIKKILGYSILGSMFAGFYAFLWAVTGLWFIPVIVFGGAIVLLGLIFLAIWLVE